jgi:sulfatase maturation enzyme AslB (radical SAM superfamily)
MDKYRYDGTKLIYHMDRVYDHFEKGIRIAPIYIDLGVTSVCNSNCIYCYAIHQKKLGEILPADLVLKIMADAPKLGVKALSVTGDGEPTLNPILYKAVQVGKEAGLDLSVCTNGVLLDKYRTDVLLANNIWLRFNLSAGTREGYKTVHRKDNWDVVSENIREAVRIKREKGYTCTIGLQMVLVPQCLNEVIPEVQFALDSGVDYLVIKQYSDTNCKDMVQVDRDWYKDENTINLLKRAENMSTKDTQIIIKWGLMTWHNDKPYKKCLDVPLLIEISGTGKVYPCGYHFRNPKFEMGDLHKQSLKEIIESEQYWEVIRYCREDIVLGIDCFGNCRHDRCNEFLWNYLDKPLHLNFI